MLQPIDEATSTRRPVGDVHAILPVNPYVFLVGSPRSGTTMLRRMVNAHPEIAITRETHWIPRFFEKQKGVRSDGRVTSGLVDKLFEHRRFAQMKVKRSQLADLVVRHPELTYAQFVSAVFDRYGRRQNKPLVGDKTPTYVRKITTIVSLWPGTRIVHLYRDGRDVYLSMRNWRMAHKAAGQFGTWQVDPVVTTALWWKALVELGRQDGTALAGRNYYEICYERLVSNSEDECAQLAAFLGVRYDEAMVRYYHGKTESAAELSANAAWLPPTSGLRDWRTQMNADEISRFEAAAGTTLEELGYERANSQVSQPAAIQVARLKEQFTREALVRKWRLPSRW